MKKFIYCLTVGVLLISCPILSWAQNKTLTGRVTARDTGEPIPFASVLIQNQPTLGVYTDDNGKFVLPNVPSSAEQLVFSYMGYKDLILLM